MTFPLYKTKLCPTMAEIERITLNPAQHTSPSSLASELGLPGLVIHVRSTTSSNRDYPELNLNDVLTSPIEHIVTDGVCS